MMTIIPEDVFDFFVVLAAATLILAIGGWIADTLERKWNERRDRNHRNN